MSAPTGHGPVHLDVTDLDRSRRFYEQVLGLVADGERLTNADGDVLVVLHPGATRPKRGRGHTGLYHLAIHVPDGAEFARVLKRVAEHRVQQSPSDHVFSKAKYFEDPDGIMIEVTVETVERLREAGVDEQGRPWCIDSDGRPRDLVEPLDVDEALSHADPDDDPRAPLKAGSRLGHVHLHVRDLDEAQRFYLDLGFQPHLHAPGMGFSDLHLGGTFPHVLAVNVWAGTTPAPEGTAGLRHFTLTGTGEDREVTDPSGNRIVLQP